MSLTISAEQVPLAADQDGVIRVAGTRLPLDNIIIVFNQGATAEEIAQRFPVVDLADVYAVISYYLHHTDEITNYLERRQLQVDEIRGYNEAQFDFRRIREILLARRG